MVEYTQDVSHYFFNWNTWVLPCVEDSSDACLVISTRLLIGIIAYGATYCKIVVATRPATGFSLFEK